MEKKMRSLFMHRMGFPAAHASAGKRNTHRKMNTGKSTKKHGARHLLAALGYSMSGLRIALGETAIRHELVLAAAHFTALAIIDPPLASKLLLTCLMGGVLMVELLNTAIEAVVDIASPGRNALAKKAKDLGSAAVFCALFVFLSCWTLVVVEVMQ